MLHQLLQRSEAAEKGADKIVEETRPEDAIAAFSPTITMGLKEKAKKAKRAAEAALGALSGAAIKKPAAPEPKTKMSD